MASETVQATLTQAARPAELATVREGICRDAAREIASIAGMLRDRADDAENLEFLMRGSLMRVEALAEAIIFCVRSSINRKDIAESYATVHGEKLLVLLGEPVEAAHV